MSVLELKGVSYHYVPNRPVFKDFSTEFEQGKVYAILGKSGSGKTTLLSLISGLDKVKGGQILYHGKDLSKINKYTYRSRNVGIVFQNYNLLPKLTAWENVALSVELAKYKTKNRKQYSVEMLQKMGLTGEESQRRILKLSGGQQQRVAIARILSYEPDVILADEPTGNLDPENRDEIMQILVNLAHEQNKCVIIVTHSQEVADSADEVLYLGKKVNTPKRG